MSKQKKQNKAPFNPAIKIGTAMDFWKNQVKIANPEKDKKGGSSGR